MGANSLAHLLFNQEIIPFPYFSTSLFSYVTSFRDNFFCRWTKVILGATRQWRPWSLTRQFRNIVIYLWSFPASPSRIIHHLDHAERHSDDNIAITSPSAWLVRSYYIFSGFLCCWNGSSSDDWRTIITIY